MACIAQRPSPSRQSCFTSSNSRRAVDIRIAPRKSTTRQRTFIRSTQPETNLSQRTISRIALQKDINSGKLLIRPMQEGDVADCASLLTRVFMNASESISSQEAKHFCEKTLTMLPRALMLVAQLTPNGIAFISKAKGLASKRLIPDPAELGPNRIHRIIGLAHMSMTSDTRPIFQNAQPPNTAAYISSMAVDKKYRRSMLKCIDGLGDVVYLGKEWQGI